MYSKGRLILDWETVDPAINDLGSGWCHGQMDLIGCSVLEHTGSTPYWLDAKEDMHEIRRLIAGHDELVAFNAQYDFGILVMLDIDIWSHSLVDVLLLGKLYDNTLPSYSLDDLSKRYLGVGKTTDEITEFVYTAGIYKENGVHKPLAWKPGNMPKFRKYGKMNLDEIYGLNPDLVIKYCNTDVQRTYELLTFFEQEMRGWD